MKTTKSTVAVLAAIAMFAFASPLPAQYRSGADDGIAASPKLREHLDERHRSEAVIAAPEIAKMQCAKCTDTVTTRVDSLARGANKPVVQVVSHNCHSCATEWKTVGTGKAKKSVAMHTCQSCGLTH